MKKVIILSAAIILIIIGMVIMIQKTGYQLPKSQLFIQPSSKIEKRPPLYINKEFRFSLLFPESYPWNNYVVDDSIRVRGSTVISFKLPDTRGNLRTVFEIEVIQGEYPTMILVEEIYGSIGTYLGYGNNHTFVFRYVYGSPDDEGPIDEILSSAARGATVIAKSFQMLQDGGDNEQ